MNILNTIRTIVDNWLDGTALAILQFIRRFHSPRQVRIIEQDDGSFRFEGLEPLGTTKSFSDTLGESLPQHLAALVEGSRIEFILNARHFLFRPLELPRRAVEFLDGIIRAQIDRLTPWTVNQAIFGYMPAVEATGEHINVIVAATARSIIAPYIEALYKLGAQSILIETRIEKPDGETSTIKLLDQLDNINGSAHIHVRRSVCFALIAAVAVTLTTVILTTAIGIALENKKIEVSNRITTKRATINANSGSKSVAIARRALEKRKREAPLSVIALEILSDVLPDDTYLTELRIQGNKLQIVGMTSNAPALISLVEQSSYFDHATFFAPTTRAPNDLHERFHIEANIRPALVPGT